MPKGTVSGKYVNKNYGVQLGSLITGLGFQRC
ncbi:hypothetical protein L1283_005856 [Sphingobacterium sp. HSC-15S19]